MEKGKNNRENGFNPPEEKIINDIKTLNLLTDPLRMKIMSMFRKPAVIKDVSAALNLSPQKLYYHVKLMEKHGLLKVVRSKIISGIVEKTYQCAAESFRPAPEIFGSGPQSVNEKSRVISNMFNFVRDEYIKRNTANESGSGGGADKLESTASISKLIIPKSKYAEVLKKIAELQESFTRCEKEGADSDEEMVNIVYFSAIFNEQEEQA